MSEMSREKYERDINLMKSMNLNMVRLHCHFQNPELYDLADEIGIGETHGFAMEARERRKV